MASPKFPGPTYNRIIDQDPQIVKVPMDYEGWGSRASAMPKDTSNSMTIRHVSNESSKK